MGFFINNLITAFCNDDFVDYSLLVAHVLGLVPRTRLVKMEIIKEGGLGVGVR